MDLDAVKDLQALSKPSHDGNGVLNGRFFHHQGLEPALQGRILFDVPSILVDRRGPDHVQLTSSQHWLQHVAGIHGPLSGAGPDHGVQLVDEHQQSALGRLHLCQHGLQSLLELAAILGPSDQGPHIQGEHRPVPKAFGYITA